MRRHRTTLLALLALALAAAPAAAAPPDRWIHLRVDEDQGGARVRINLPLALVQRVAELVPPEANAGGRLKVDDEEITAAELRQIWRSLAEGRNVRRFATDDPDETVYAWRHGGYLHLRVQRRESFRAGLQSAQERSPSRVSGTGSWDEHRFRPGEPEDVHVKVPAAVVEALLSGREDELNVGAAVAALARQGEGELMTAAGDDETLRIWIDGTPESR